MTGPPRVIAHITVESMPDFLAHIAPHDPDFAADVPNFTNIRPVIQIEEVIVTIPGVVDCSISAIFDEILGEALKAEVVVADLNDPNMQESAFKKLCGEKLAMEKVPQVFEFTGQMKIAATGKKTKKLNSV